MHIGIDIRALLTAPRTGIGEYTFELLDAIFKLDKKNEYYLYYNSYGDVASCIPPWHHPNVHFVATHYPNKLFNASLKILHHPKLDRLTLNRLPATSYQLPPTLDYFFSPNLGFTTISSAAKHILTVHDLSFEFFPEYYTARQRLWHKIINPKKQCAQAHQILVPSENTKQDITNYYKINPEKISVIYPGLSPTFNIRHLTFDIKDKYFLPENFILFLGTIEPRKNIITLIDAFEQFVANNHPTSYQLPATSLSLVIAGAPGWKDSSIYKRANASLYKDKIKFLGYIAPEDKAALYTAASIFVYPSFYEGFGFPVLEAMAAGTPVITANRSSLPEVVENAAYLVNPHKPNEIAVGLKLLLEEKQLRLEYIKKSREQATKFMWEKAAKEWLAVLEK